MTRIAVGLLVAVPVGCKKNEDVPETAKTPSTPKVSEEQACRAETLESYAKEVGWLGARALAGPAPAASWTVAHDEIPRLHDPNVAVVDYALGPEGLTADGHEVGPVGIDPAALHSDLEAADLVLRGVASAREQALDLDTWRLTVDPKTPAHRVATLLLALRERGRPSGQLVFSTPTEPPAGALDEEVLGELRNPERLSEYIDDLTATFPCPAMMDLFAKHPPVPPGWPGLVPSELAAAMVTCQCKPSAAAYRSLLSATAIGAAPRDRVGVTVPLTIDLSADAIDAPKGATWADIVTAIDDPSPRRTWVSAPEVAIPSAWRSDAAKDCRFKADDRCILACELGDEASCPAAEQVKAAAALTPAMRACAENIPFEPPPPPPPPPPIEIDEAAVLAAPTPKPPAPPDGAAVVRRKDTAALLRQLGIGPGCEAKAWLAKHRAAPDDESLYCVLSLVYEECEQPDEAMKWAVERTKAFADRPGPWLGLAARHYASCAEDPVADSRTLAAIGHAMIEATDRALALDPKSGKAHTWAAAAHQVRAQGRPYVESPSTKADHRERHEMLADLLASWRHASHGCETPGVLPCPPPPFRPDEIDAIDALAGKLHPESADEH